MPKRRAVRAEEGIRRAADGEAPPQKRFFRQRAHINPLSTGLMYEYPLSWDRMDWTVHFPAYPTVAHNEIEDRPPHKRVEIADVGCGFGGLLMALAPAFPDTLMMGMEIRPRVAEYVRLRILAARRRYAATHGCGADGHPAATGGDVGPTEAAAPTATGTASGGAGAREAEVDTGGGSTTKAPTPVVDVAARPHHHYNNVTVLKSNAMKNIMNFVAKGQMTKLFFCFPDPHFKKVNIKRRIIAVPLLTEYAYCLKEGGMLYTITDVRDLHNWMVANCDAHPLFARVPDDELAGDPCVPIMRTYTEEGIRVERNHGNKYVAVYRRLPDAAASVAAGGCGGGAEDATAARVEAFWHEPELKYTFTRVTNRQYDT